VICVLTACKKIFATAINLRRDEQEALPDRRRDRARTNGRYMEYRFLLR